MSPLAAEAGRPVLGQCPWQCLKTTVTSLQFSSPRWNPPQPRFFQSLWFCTVPLDLLPILPNGPCRHRWILLTRSKSPQELS